ncbi:unnamed protein product [Cercospora beticola]|nr:unnamed protein product [Cercospora beticola]
MRDYNEIKSFVEAVSLVLYDPNLDWTQFESGWNEHSKGGRFIGPYAAGGTMGLGGQYNTLRSMKWPMFLVQTVSGGYTLKMECQKPSYPQW